MSDLRVDRRAPMRIQNDRPEEVRELDPSQEQQQVDAANEAKEEKLPGFADGDDYIQDSGAPAEGDAQTGTASAGVQQPERPLTRDEITGKLWEMARVPTHAIQKLSDAELQKTYQDVKARVDNGPGKYELKVGSHNVKFEVGQQGELKSSETKKPSVWGTIGKVALTVASFVPGPVGIVARVAQGVISAVQAAKSKNWLGAVGAAASAFGAGAAGLASKGFATAGRIANGAAQSIRGVQGIQNGGFGGIVNGALGVAAGALNAVGDAANNVAGKLDRLSTRLQPAVAAEQVIAANRNVNKAQDALRAAQASGDQAAIARAQQDLSRAEQAKRGALLSGGAAVAGAAGTFVGNRAQDGSRNNAQVALDGAARGLNVARSVNDRDWASAATGGLSLGNDLRQGTAARNPRFDPLTRAADLAERANGVRITSANEQALKTWVQDAETYLMRARRSGNQEAIAAGEENLKRARRALSQGRVASYYANDSLAAGAQYAVTNFRQTRAYDSARREQLRQQAQQQLQQPIPFLGGDIVIDRRSGS